MHIIALFLYSFLSFNCLLKGMKLKIMPPALPISATSAAISSPIDPHEANPSHTYPSAATITLQKTHLQPPPLLPTPLQSTSLQQTSLLQSPLQPTLLFIQPIPLLLTTL